MPPSIPVPTGPIRQQALADFLLSKLPAHVPQEWRCSVERSYPSRTSILFELFLSLQVISEAHLGDLLGSVFPVPANIGGGVLLVHRTDSQAWSKDSCRQHRLNVKLCPGEDEQEYLEKYDASWASRQPRQAVSSRDVHGFRNR